MWAILQCLLSYAHRLLSTLFINLPKNQLYTLPFLEDEVAEYSAHATRLQSLSQAALEIKLKVVDSLTNFVLKLAPSDHNKINIIFEDFRPGEKLKISPNLPPNCKIIDGTENVEYRAVDESLIFVKNDSTLVIYNDVPNSIPSKNKFFLVVPNHTRILNFKQSNLNIFIKMAPFIRLDRVLPPNNFDKVFLITEIDSFSKIMIKFLVIMKNVMKISYESNKIIKIILNFHNLFFLKDDLADSLGEQIEQFLDSNAQSSKFKTISSRTKHNADLFPDSSPVDSDDEDDID